MCACSQDENQIAIVNAPIHIFLFGFKRKFRLREKAREVYLTDVVRNIQEFSNLNSKHNFPSFLFLSIEEFHFVDFLLTLTPLSLINILKWKTYVTEILHELCGGGLILRNR